MKIKVGKGRLLCEPPAEMTESEGGIQIPLSALDSMKSMHALVIKSGSEDFDEGERVYFGKYSGIEVELGEKTYLIIAAEEVLLSTFGG